MNRNLKTILYFIIAILVFGLIFKLFIQILPFIIILVAAIWIINKIRGYINGKKNKDKNYTYQSNNSDSSKDYEEVNYEEDDIDPSKAIDVDYEEVDKK